MGRLLRAKNLLGINSLSFLSFPDSLPLGEFLNHVDFRKGLRVAGQVARAPAAGHTAPCPPALLHPFLVSSFPEMPFPTLLQNSCCLLCARGALAQPEPLHSPASLGALRVSVHLPGGLGPQEEGWDPQEEGGPRPDWPLGPAALGE